MATGRSPGSNWLARSVRFKIRCRPAFRPPHRPSPTRAFIFILHVTCIGYSCARAGCSGTMPMPAEHSACRSFGAPHLIQIRRQSSTPICTLLPMLSTWHACPWLVATAPCVPLAPRRTATALFRILAHSVSFLSLARPTTLASTAAFASTGSIRPRQRLFFASALMDFRVQTAILQPPSALIHKTRACLFRCASQEHTKLNRPRQPRTDFASLT